MRTTFRNWFGLFAAVACLAGLSTPATALTEPNSASAISATIPSPIGPITEGENTWMHTNPINLTQYMADPIYRAQILALPAMADTAAQDAALNPPSPATAYLTSQPIRRGAVLSSTLEHWGYFCAGTGPTGCLNNWGTGGLGNVVKFGEGLVDNYNGQFNQWYYGNVNDQWPFANTAFASHYWNNAVFQYAWAPAGSGSGLCISSIPGEDQPLEMEHCGDRNDELWVWDGNAHWVNVLWTANDYNENPTNPSSWCAGANVSNTNTGNRIFTKTGCSLKWHFYAG